MKSASASHDNIIHQSLKTSLNGSFSLGIIIGFILALVGPNFLEAIVSLGTFLILFRLFYAPGIPNVILVALLFQWLQISIKVWYGNILGLELHEIYGLYKSDDYLLDAFYLSSIGLIVLALGIHVVTRQINVDKFYFTLTQEIRYYNVRKILIAYVALTLVLSILFGLRMMVPGLNTIIVALGKIKWGFYVLFLFSALTTRKYMRTFILISIIEIVFSLTGYFSGFKDFIIFIFVGLISFTNLLNFKRITVLIPILIITFYFGALWSAIKGDYRQFLSGGTDRQIVVVSELEALDYLWNRLDLVDYAQLQHGIDQLVDRVSFIDLFSLALDYVPDVLPHEKGEIWKSSILHFFKPRLFFPDKPIIDDSEHSSKYTGIYFADSSQGVSHSIGFMADSYIDYGPVFMFIPIFFLGLMIGFLYKHFLLKSYNTIWDLIYALSFYLLISFYSFNLIKVIGNLLIYVVLLFIINRRLAKWVNPFLIKAKTSI
jgi:hypothetical protein